MEFVRTGVEGLNEMLGGGIPKGHVVAVLGGFGTGKTTLALQFVKEGLKNGEKCIFITLEESDDSIRKNAESFGWDLSKYEGENLSLIKLEPADVKSTLTKVRSELPSYVKKFGAERVVIDSVSLLSMMFPNEAERRTHLFDLCQVMRNAGSTTILTAEAKDDNPKSSRDGLVEYVSDGVISLQFQQTKGSSDVQLVIQIVKMRRTAHSRRMKPYSITGDGIVVHTEAEVF
ncbi:MAG: KaiC domain-containing protein [Methanomassiliicoccales archaeon]|nr:MAG: KaiC domain-containing protein [Methanomassiliicoccales archaeon]